MKTIPSIVVRAANNFGPAPALEEGGDVWTYAELKDRMDRAAAAFIAAGLDAGDRVAIWAPNCRDWIVAALGVMAAGGAIVPLNTRMKGEEAAYILNKSRATFLVTVSGFLDIDYPALLEGCDLPHLRNILLLDGQSEVTGLLDWQDFFAAGAEVDRASVEARRRAVMEEDVSDIIFTSGTTGKPKGVPLSHGQTLSMVNCWSDHVGLRAGDRYLIVNPFFHTFGYKAGWLPCILQGATILPHAVFDVPAILSRIAREHISVLPGPPTLYQSLLSDPALDKADISSLRLAVTGAAVIPVQLIENIRNRLGIETVITAYGLTEACGVVTMCNPDDSDEKIATTSGRPVEGMEVRIVDDNLYDLPQGEAGEILVRGYTVMKGYFEDEIATADALTPDCWLRTGDIGVLDEDGYLKITDRKKDMLIIGGFNCYPAEVENIMLDHPAIAQVAVVGRSDERMGEVPVAFVVQNEEGLTEQKLVNWCRLKMANYKVPRAVYFVDVLPLNAAGKVQKFALRERLANATG
ncbi:FadD3 family acyl-CoA ligase [Emcibacter sp.]|uniref:FadD3 family acyl-CoA ligase n=1 Tax=Emcibacter sp. TaxID=1979954 RepID=UPI002AA6D1D9|nr:FadD3 family acyl-CoA ligase [Emcibacter sp.]